MHICEVCQSVNIYIYIYICAHVYVWCQNVDYICAATGHRVAREVRFGVCEVACVCDGGVRVWGCSHGPVDG